jgi:hypothetical protein
MLKRLVRTKAWLDKGPTAFPIQHEGYGGVDTIIRSESLGTSEKMASQNC